MCDFAAVPLKISEYRKYDAASDEVVKIEQTLSLSDQQDVLVLIRRHAESRTSTFWAPQ